MSGTIPGIEELAPEMRGWRHDLHAHPETAFAEHRTAAFVAARLEAFGVEVHRGLAGTGVVGVLRNGEGAALALRADMDALAMDEHGELPYRSTQPGHMHACGHDGHTAMLLGAARYLAETRAFRGAAVFIFQPAEENEGGGRVMVEEGLFERFPVEAVYGLHNWPGLPAGRFAVRPGPMMASYDVFEAVVTGRGTHAAMPHLGNDPVVAAAQIVTAWQTIASRAVDPLDAAVVSVTQLHAGDTWNVLPESVILRGTARSFRAEVQDRIERGLREIAEGVCAAFGMTCALRYERRYPATVNTAAEADHALRAAARVVGRENVDVSALASMGAEDFAFMLRKKPGCYVWLGNGPAEGGRALHSPYYDFNDAILPIGASYWARLVETVLAP